jgi:nuclear GTP-binding protein
MSSYRKGGSSDNPDKGRGGKGHEGQKGAHKRDKNTVQRLLMYRGGKPTRDVDGKITGGEYMSKNQAGGSKITTSTGRVAPDRRWFGNTRVIDPKALDSARQAVEEKKKDPYTVLLQPKTLPMSLLTEKTSAAVRAHLLSSSSFSTTFGAKAQRKRVTLSITDVEGLAHAAQAAVESYASVEGDDKARVDVPDADRALARHSIFDKGGSKRIWGELYKVLDCSDVVIQVLDARDPLGTRSTHVERYLSEHAKHKHLVFVLNKCDLVPTWVTRRWVALLSQEYPTLAFHANMKKPFGKGALIALLRQFARLHSDKKSISVGFIGYPNTGKSSIINALKSKKVCSVAPIPGETKIWQYVTLTKKVYLIDCPGVVYPSGDSEADIVLKGTIHRLL